MFTSIFLKFAQISHLLVTYLHLSQECFPQLRGLLSTPSETLAHSMDAAEEKNSVKKTYEKK